MQDNSAGDTRAFKFRLLSSLLCVILVLALILPTSAYADTEEGREKRVVRVGWYESELFQKGSSDTERKSGYAYDYLRKLSDYANWEYEYVYGQWPELYDMLCRGEIDFMAGISATAERDSLFLFPNSPMGTDKYYLYKHAKDSSINVKDPASFEGKKVGLVKNTRMSDLVQTWFERNGIEAEMVYYEGFSAMDEAFENGEIDLVTSTLDSASNQEWISAIVELGEEPYYLAVNRYKPDLLEELNEAIANMNSVDPYVLQNLQYNNYGTARTAKTVTDEEKNWLAEHPVIRVGYMENYLPYSATGDDGQATGLGTDVINAVFDSLYLDTIPEIEYVAYKGYPDIVAALDSDEIDIAFPVDSDQWRLEQDGISASSEVITDRGALFYKTICEKEDIKTLAVNGNNILQDDYTRQLYPDVEIIYYPSIDECLKAILAGEVDGTIMDALRVQVVTDNPDYEGLSYVQLGEGTGKCFGVAQGNRALLMLVNRGLKVLGSSYGYDCSYKYVDSMNSYDVQGFLKEFQSEIIIVSACLTTLAIVLLVAYIRKQRKELAIKEELKREAEEANLAKSMFLFNMSHDIRTPMNAVLGFNELMARDIDKPDKLSEYIAKTKLSGEYLLGLINNVLEVARIDSGNETLNEDFVDLESGKFHVIFENEAAKKKLNMINKIDVEHRYVYADRYKLREILLNIVSNAIKYTPEGGTIQISVQEKPCDVAGQAIYNFVVADTGIGMSEEFQKHIFEIFARERNSTESKVMGTGLGMSIVKKLTELMGGTVTVQSELGKGSTFTMSFKLRIIENPEKFLKAEQEIEHSKEINLEGRRILVAEDNELNAEITTSILENLGAIIDMVPDGVECVRMIQSHEAGYYDLVLMDIQMPNLNGYDATKKIRRFSDTAKAAIPIVAMTANAFDEDKKKALEVGMNGHISKPVSVEEIAKVLTPILKKSK